jgi:putative nucleotidyltransferase with HDIG domain
MSVYQVVLVLVTCGLATAVYLAGEGLANPWAVAGLAFAATFSERGRVRLGENIEASISLIPTVFAAAMFGPLAAMVVAATSFAGEFPLFLAQERRQAVLERGSPYLKWGIYSCLRSLSGGIAGLAAWGATAAFGVAFAAFTMRLRGGRGREVFLALGPVVLASIPLYTPIVGLLGIAYLELSPWTLALFFVPALAAQRLFALYQSQRELAEGLTFVNGRLSRANLSFATALVATLDARDRYTAGHSAAVAVYARDIADRMGFSRDEVQLAHVCGLVHDIGKIGLSAGLLEKPGALTLDERREMQRHSEIGEGILAKVDSYSEIALVVRHHHERVDGQGYPDGLVEQEVPMLSRIIAVADAYNAMTSDRPYRDAMPSRVARLRLAQAVETQFDTTVVAAFEAILAGASEDYRVGRGDEFVLEELDLISSADYAQVLSA